MNSNQDQCTSNQDTTAKRIVQAHANDSKLSFNNQSSVEVSKSTTGKISYRCKSYADSVEKIQQKLHELIQVAEQEKKYIENKNG